MVYQGIRLTCVLIYLTIIYQFIRYANVEKGFLKGSYTAE